MDITHLTPDAEGSIEWPSFSKDVYKRQASARPASRGIEHAESEHSIALAHSTDAKRRVNRPEEKRVCMETYTNS